MKKRSIYFIICVMTIFSMMGSVFSAAAEDIDEISGVYGEEALQNLTAEMQLEELNSDRSVSEAAKTIALEKLNFMMLSEAERTNEVQSKMTTRSLVAIKMCNVPFFKQEKNYWCGPATAKQTIHYLTKGSYSPTQTQIAGYIGTTTAGSSSTNIANWLRKQGYYYNSVSVSSMTTRDIVNYVATDLDAYDNPCFGGVKITSGLIGTNRWHYTTNGHILNISGIQQYEPDYNNSLIQVTDPYITWKKPSITSGKYYVSVGDYKSAMTSFWW